MADGRATHPTSGVHRAADPGPGPGPGPDPRLDPGPDGDHVLAAVAYLVGIVTGLVVYLVAPRDDRYARWHALQSIAVSLVVFAVTVLLALAAAFARLDARLVGGLDAPLMGLWSVSGVWGLVGLAALLLLAVQAYRGETLRVPGVASLADRWA